MAAAASLDDIDIGVDQVEFALPPALHMADGKKIDAAVASAAARAGRRHWAVGYAVAVLDACLTAATIAAGRLAYVEPPRDGEIDTTALAGWLGLCGAIVIFGGGSIMIKTPTVQEANCDPMVFQCYCSTAVALVSLLVWAVGCAEVPSFEVVDSGSVACGALFAVVWVSSQVLCVKGIQALGCAIAVAMIDGITICTSFFWGVLAFGSRVRSVPGVAMALCLMVAGVALATASSDISDREAARRRARELRALAESVSPGVKRTASLEVSPSLSVPDAAEDKSGRMRAKLIGFACVLGMGLGNGSLMVPMTLFQRGIPALGIQAYAGSELASLAFLPSISIGVLLAQPVLFLIYWAHSLCAGRRPQFHFRKVAVPGLLTGAYWGMGNFCAMYATIYLGQTVGFPLTQLCLVVNGLWGILYYREIRGRAALSLFVFASLVILGGAVLQGLSV